MTSKEKIEVTKFGDTVDTTLFEQEFFDFYEQPTSSDHWWIPKETVVRGQDALDDDLVPMDLPKSYNTTVETKQKFFKKFADLIEGQFKHGGNKYKLQGFEDREATDVISAIVPNWVEGTILKYVFRFMNFRREKDLLKIATYCYILWLKEGHHLSEEHDEDTKQ
jgi:hypothetical protein